MKTDATPERIRKLPAWARLHMARLEEKISGQNDVINMMRGVSAPDATGKIKVNIGPMDGGLREFIALPDHITVQFKFGDDFHRISMNHHMHEPVIEIYSHPGIIHILPRSGNAINLACENVFERKKIGD